MVQRFRHQCPRATSLASLLILLVGAAGYAFGAPPPPNQWLESLEVLAAIDDRLAAGDVDAALAGLESAESGWDPPFSEIAARYHSLINDTGDPATLALGGGVGVELLAVELARLAENPLRTTVEEHILNSHSARRDACAEVLVANGNRAFEAGDPGLASAMYDRAVREYPRSHHRGVAQFNLGAALGELGQFEEAIAAFKTLLELDVDNNEFIGTSIMTMSYRNYHHRAAASISWSYEQLGKFDEAYHWIELASSQYPFEAMCGNAISGNRRYLARAADRIALAGSLRLVASHPAGQAWYAWLIWLGWCTAAVAMFRASRACWSVIAHSTAAVAFAAASTTVLLHPGLDLSLGYGFFYRIYWQSTVVIMLCWTLPTLGFLAVAVLARRRPKTATAVCGAVIVLAILCSGMTNRCDPPSPALRLSRLPQCWPLELACTP